MIRSTLEFQKAPLDYTLSAARAARATGDVASWRVGPMRWWLLVRPEHIYDVLVGSAAKFGKPTLVGRLWRHFLGQGLLSLEGGEWRRHHRMVRPAFLRERIEGYGATMVRYTEEMVAGWEEGARRDMAEEMTALTLRIVAQTLFGADVLGDARHVGECMTVISDKLVEHINRPLPVPRWWPSKGNRAKHRAISDMEAVVLRIIAERRRSGRDHGDLLSTLVLARDEGSGLTDRELRDEAMTLFFAGHETTSLALVWMWYLLAAHPDVAARLAEELAEVVPDPRASLAVADLERLPYLDQVVKESMRILPSVWSFMRAPAGGPYSVPGADATIPEGDVIFMSPYVTHRDERWWTDPDRFDPSRFDPSSEERIPRGAYIPFALGPRMCLGKNFALMEARLILGTLVRRLIPHVPEGFEPTLLPQLALKPEEGMPFDVRPRT